jgi:predicted transcriptional regulator
MNEPTNPVSIDPELDREVERLARETGLSRAEVIRRALRHYLAARYIKEVRARLNPFAVGVGFHDDGNVFDGL